MDETTIPAHRHIREFLSDWELEALLSDVLPHAIWTHSEQNGSVGMWIPSITGFTHYVVDIVTSRARLDMDVKETSDSDVIFLRYNVGDHLRPHTDVHSAGHQIRCGVLLLPPNAGGSLFIGDAAVPMVAGDAVVYRPDLVSHGVSPVEDGTRYLMTIGSVFT